jgi:hypothetical protein
MLGFMGINLNIDDKLKGLIPPLSSEEFLQLEQNILSQGCRDAIVTWNGTIVDGHNRYEICTRHGLAFSTINKFFMSRKDVVLWILQNQLGRRNLSDAARIEIALRKASFMTHKTEPVRKTVADDAGVCEQTVQKYMRIREIADPDLLERLQKGKEKIGAAHKFVEVTTTRKICTSEEIKQINESLKPKKHKTMRDNAAKIGRLYDSVLRNYRLLGADTLRAVRERLMVHMGVLEQL